MNMKNTNLGGENSEENVEEDVPSRPTCNRVLLEKLIVAKTVNKFSAF
jgi:hypothetical protein